MIIRIRNFAVPAWRIEAFELKQDKVHIQHDGRISIVADSTPADFEALLDQLNAFHSSPITHPAPEDEELPEPEVTPAPITRKVTKKKKRRAPVDSENQFD